MPWGRNDRSYGPHSQPWQLSPASGGQCRFAKKSETFTDKVALTHALRSNRHMARPLLCKRNEGSNGKMVMLKKIGRLFVIKTRWEAFMIIFALALGAVERGSAYLDRYPGFGGKLLFLACTGSVFMAGAKILDCLRHEKAAAAQSSDRRPRGDAEPIGRT